MENIPEVNVSMTAAESEVGLEESDVEGLLGMDVGRNEAVVGAAGESHEAAEPIATEHDKSEPANAGGDCNAAVAAAASSLPNAVAPTRPPLHLMPLWPLLPEEERGTERTLMNTITVFFPLG